MKEFMPTGQSGLEKNVKKDPEKDILSNQEKLLALAGILRRVYEKRPDPEKFVGAMSDNPKFAGEYTPQAIEADERYVEETREEIEKKNSAQGRNDLDRREGGFALSEMMQAIIVDRINNGWFEDLKAVMTTDYDDLKYGVDAVVKHKQGGYLGMAFDFTVANQENIIYEKLKKEWSFNVSKGKIPTIKYFEDPDTGKKGKLLVPKFIIGGSKKDVEEIAEAYLGGDSEALTKHPLKLAMIDQIEVQLNYIISYYEDSDDEKEFEFAKKRYEQILEIIKSLKASMSLSQEEKLTYHEYSKNSVALQTMKRFSIVAESGKITV